MGRGVLASDFFEELLSALGVTRRRHGYGPEYRLDPGVDPRILDNPAARQDNLRDLRIC
jgi:hypothetical protein